MRTEPQGLQDRKPVRTDLKPRPDLADRVSLLQNGHFEAALRHGDCAGQTGNPGPLLTMACSGGTIRLTSVLEGPVALRTSAGTDQIRFDGGAASVPSRDIRLDRIAFSRGRFALEAPGGSGLTLPVQSEIGRVIEDCRG